VAETRKLVAILAADVVGYSRLAGTDEDRTLARLRALRSDLIDPTVAVHNGRVVKRTGDGSLIEFRSVVDAVRCAIEVQTGMVERNAGLPPERRIEFRVGIHLGDVVEESDGDLMGDGVNIAARLEGIAKPGAICLSEDAYRQVSGRLDIEITDLGFTQLKNIERPIHAYSLQVGIPAQAKQTSATKPSKPKLRLALVLGAVGGVALIVVGAAGVWHYLSPSQPAPIASIAPAPAMVGQFSVVVLPFANLSGDPAQDYLADALTDQLTTALARSISRGFVIARNTAFTYKGKSIDAKTIGKELGVRYMLEGSIQPSGTQVRVNAQLIDTNNGAHLWVDQFDANRADLLQMQDQIVRRLANTLRTELIDVEARRIERSSTANTDANDLAWRCFSIVRNAVWTGKQAEAGYALCEQALVADPNNPVALRTLSMKFYFPAAIGRSVDPKADFERGNEFLTRAMALDPDNGTGHFYKATILNAQGRFDEAIAEGERALALDPALASAFFVLSDAYRFQGQFEKSREFIDKAIQISPRDRALGYWYNGRANDYFGLNNYDKAIDWAQRSIAINANNWLPNATLAAALALSGRETEARDALQRYLALDPRFTIATAKGLNAQYSNSQSDLRMRDYWDRWIEGLREAGLPEQ
jgi:adenylate cyclase